MQIREANMKDSEGIKNLHLQAFDNSEAESIGTGVVNRPLRMLLTGAVLVPTGFLMAGLRIE